MKVALAYTGGLDSFLALQHGVHQGAQLVPFHLDIGQPYAHAERVAIAKQGVDCHLVDIDVGLQQLLHSVAYDGGTPAPGYEAVIPGRNLLIAVLGANLAPVVWLCAAAGEMHPYGNRDKSVEWFYGTSSALTYSWQPVRPDTRVEAPLGHLTKAQAVVYALETLGVTEREIRATRSCYTPDGEACGRCKACWHRFVALWPVGIQEHHLHNPRAMPVAEAEYRQATEALATGNHLHMNEQRCLETVAAYTGGTP